MRMALRAAAATVAAFGVLAAPAGLAAADKTAQETIDQLESEGYTVNIDRIGTGPTSDCVVTSVRNPNTVTQWLPAIGPVLGTRDQTVLVETVVSKTISVSLNCTG